MAEARVLSIQSHVVFGYVGNKSATFPLQLLGFEVDAINSVQFSNHTGYKKFTGQVLTEKDLGDLAEGLSSNQLDNYSHLLTGYVGAISFLKRIGALVKHLKTINPNLVYVCDPVMGDNGKMYVPPELLPVYKDLIVPLADIVTPNQYELELLTDTTVSTVEEVWDAINILHAKGCKTVVISSSTLADENCLLGFASRKSSDETVRAMIKIPKVPANFTGTGDLFTALFLAWMHKTNNNVKFSLENTIATLQDVLKKTFQYAEGTSITPRNLELKLIQSKKFIEEPAVEIKADYV